MAELDGQYLSLHFALLLLGTHLNMEQTVR